MQSVSGIQSLTHQRKTPSCCMKKTEKTDQSDEKNQKDVALISTL